MASRRLLVICELKLQFNLELVLQGVDRAAACDEVWLAARMSARGKGREHDRRFRALCRRLGFGLLAVSSKGEVELLLSPAALPPRRDPKRRSRLMEEHQRRRGDPVVGGGSRAPIMTAYRQDALACAAAMTDGPKRPRDLKTISPRAASILLDNVYGWFARAERGVYALTEVVMRRCSAGRRWRTSKVRGCRRQSSEGEALQPPVSDAVEICRKVLHRHLALAAVAACVDGRASIAAFAGGAEAGNAVSDRQPKTAFSCKTLQQAAIRRPPCPRPEFRPQGPWLEWDRQIGLTGAPGKVQPGARHPRCVGGHKVRPAGIGRGHAGVIKRMRNPLACFCRRHEDGRQGEEGEADLQTIPAAGLHLPPIRLRCLPSPHPADPTRGACHNSAVIDEGTMTAGP